MNELCIVEVGSRLSGKWVKYFPERDTGDMTKPKTLDDIWSGEVEDVERVIVLSPDGTWRDATCQTAVEILTRAVDNGEVPRHLVDFLEENLGCAAVAEVMREMGQAA